MEDAQSATGFGGQLENVAFTGKIMADSETQKLEGKDFFQRIVEKVDGGFFQTVLSERHREGVRFVRIEMFHVLDQFVILPRSAVSEEAAACQSEG